MINPYRRRTVILLLAVFTPWNCERCFAQNFKRVADREAARRQAAFPQGEAALARGKAAMAVENYVGRHEEFRLAVSLLPDAVVGGKAHDEAVNGFCVSGVKLAEQRIAEASYAEAETICREILGDRYEPNFRRAAELLAHLQEPGYFNRTVGPKFLSKVEEVRKLLGDADGYYNSGRYDLAFKKYEQVLNLDPYNVAARRGEEQINLTKTHYGEEAYNETRSRQLWQGQKAWEEPVKKYGETIGTNTETFPRDATGTARISHKLNTIIIPRIEFRDASVREAFEFLRQQAEENDPGADGRKGVDIVLRLNAPGAHVETIATSSTAAADNSAEPNESVAAAPPLPADARITITLNQIPLGEAWRYIASQAGLKVKIEAYAVSIVPLSELSNELITKQYRVPPGFISGSLNPSGSALNQPSTTGAKAPLTMTGTAQDTQESAGGRLLVNREGAKEFLQGQGVSFSVPGSSANFLPQTSRLIVRNTTDNLELVDAIVEQANISGPKQVEIESKFIEINQSNLKELGFDWLLGQFNVPGSSRVFGSGGATANSPAYAPGNYPFTSAAGDPVGQFPVTGGNRSGTLAITGNAIDTLLGGGTNAAAVAPGIFGLAGVFTDPQFQVVIRALNQKKGIDLLSAPRVTTKSGQRAVIEIVREFRYPTQFQAPQIPTTFGGSNNPNVSLGNSTGGTFPVTPTTPTGFETRNTGVTLEVEPVVGPDGITIDLNLVPQVVEFEGFINYGSPIRTSSVNALGMAQTVELTPIIINQPVFSTRKVTTSVRSEERR